MQINNKENFVYLITNPCGMCKQIIPFEIHIKVINPCLVFATKIERQIHIKWHFKESRNYSKILLNYFVDKNQWQIKDFQEGARTPEEGRQPTIWPIFPKNCMKMKKFWPRRGGARPWYPLDPTLRIAGKFSAATGIDVVRFDHLKYNFLFDNESVA